MTMKSAKLAKALMAAGLALTLVAVPVSSAVVHADDQVTSSSTSANSTSQNQTHTLKKSYVVYGAGAADKDELSQVLAVGDDFTTLTATAADYQKYINPNDSTTNAAMVSSVSIVPTDPGSGVQVNVKKFNGDNNITKVTAQQYAT